MVVYYSLYFDEKLVNDTKLIITAISRFCISAHHTASSDTVVIQSISFKFSKCSRKINKIYLEFFLQLAL